MAAKGTTEKDLITQQILSIFEGSFICNKEIRVPINDVQIKISLTCAKENVTIDGPATPAAVLSDAGFPSPVTPAKELNAPTQEELDNVKTLMERLGL